MIIEKQIDNNNDEIISEEEFLEQQIINECVRFFEWDGPVGKEIW